MKLLPGLHKLLDRTVDGSALIAGVIFGLVTLSVCIDIFMRYFFNRPVTGVLESTEYSLLFFTLLGAIWVLKKDHHVKMDLVIGRLKPVTRELLNVITSVLSAMVCGTITYYGILVVIERFKTGHRLVSTLEPLSYPLTAVIPFCFFLMFIQFLISAYRSWGKAKSMPKDTRQGNSLH